MTISDQEIGLRAQDIQTGLQDVDLSSLASGLIDNVRLIGMAERLAVHLRGAEVVEDYERLCAVASRLGIDSLILPSVLSVLEEVEFVRVHRAHGRIDRVYESVPYFGNIYGEMGSLWRSRGPSEVEQASIEILHRLTSSPITEEEFSGFLGLSVRDLAIVKDLGVNGGYINHYDSPDDGAQIVYSPLFWEENPEVLYQLLKKYSADEIADAVRPCVSIIRRRQ